MTTNNELTPELLATLQRLNDKVLFRPWSWDDDHVFPGLCTRNGGIVLRCGQGYGPIDEEGEVIVAAVNALPALLAAVDERDRMRETLERAEAKLSVVKKTLDTWQRFFLRYEHLTIERDTARLRDLLE